MATFSAQYYEHGAATYEYNIDVDELDERSPRAVCPPCNIELKPHQLSLLQRCIDFERGELLLQDFPSMQPVAHPEDTMRSKMGIIGDRVGSGKSYVVLALIRSHDITHHQDVVIKSYGYNTVVFNMKQSKTCVPTNLLVIPHNLALQWETYITHFADNLSYTMISKRKTLDKFLTNEEKVEDKALIVVTSTFYNKFASYVDEKGLRFQRVFYDEVDSLQIPGCKQIHAKFYWLITASFGNALYPRGFSKWEPALHRYIWCANGISNSGFIKNLLLELSTYIPKNLMKVLVLKNREAFVEHSLRLPSIQKSIVRCRTPVSIRILHGLVERNIIECLNANDMQGALQYINPSNKSTEDNIVSILIDKYQKQLCNLQIRLDSTEQFIYESDQEKQAEVAKITKRYQEVEEKIKMIKERISSSNTCAICYDTMEKKTITPCCQNSFCFKCIHLWMTQQLKCPMCKSDIHSDTLYVVAPEEANASSSQTPVELPSMEDVHDQHDKYTNLEIVLRKRAPGSKILIFSNYDSSFTQIYDILRKLRIQYEHLKGNASQINATLQRYKQGSVDVLMINTRFYGSGLNLENTTDVMMFHKFDTEIEKQVIGRAHRMGRTDPLRVWYFLHENEIA